MFDVDGLKKSLNYGQSFKEFKKKEFTFQFARCSDFVDGTFRIRILPPHVERAPQGYHLLSMHTIEITPENKVRVLAQESWDPDYNPQEEPSYVDALLQMIHENMDVTYNRMTDACKNVVGNLVPWRRYLYPIAIYANKEVYVEEGRNKVRYTPNHDPNAKPIGLIWEVTAESLVERIGDLMTDYPDLGDQRKGRFLRFRKKGNKYRLDAEPDKAPFVAPDLISDYPNLVRMGLKQKMSDDQIKSMVLESWWAPHFEALGIDLGGDSVPQETGRLSAPPAGRQDRPPAPHTAPNGSRTPPPASPAPEKASGSFYSDDADWDDEKVPFAT